VLPEARLTRNSRTGRSTGQNINFVGGAQLAETVTMSPDDVTIHTVPVAGLVSVQSAFSVDTLKKRSVINQSINQAFIAGSMAHKNTQKNKEERHTHTHTRTTTNY